MNITTAADLHAVGIIALLWLVGLALVLATPSRRPSSIVRPSHESPPGDADAGTPHRPSCDALPLPSGKRHASDLERT
ncbi:MAG: hypothetical protein GY772_21760 [bacterium]|nr:hypothetical protein [bacterium]